MGRSRCGRLPGAVRTISTWEASSDRFRGHPGCLPGRRLLWQRALPVGGGPPHPRLSKKNEKLRVERPQTVRPSGGSSARPGPPSLPSAPPGGGIRPSAPYGGAGDGRMRRCVALHAGSCSPPRKGSRRPLPPRRGSCARVRHYRVLLLRPAAAVASLLARSWFSAPL